MKRLVIILLASSLLMGCSHREKTSPDKAQKVIDSITRVAAQRNDTIAREDYSSVIQIDTPSVVFFMPDFEEQQKAYRFYGYYSKFQLEQIFRNFRRLYSIARPELLKDSINTFLTYHWKFHIRTDSGYVDFDRKVQDELLGFILTDAHRQPQIFYGVYRLRDFQKLIRDYFNLPEFKLKEKFVPIQPSRIEGNP